jgi:uncharacterized membrane protein YsdA (DUF1294 family)
MSGLNNMLHIIQNVSYLVFFKWNEHSFILSCKNKNTQNKHTQNIPDVELLIIDFTIKL